MSLYHMHVSGAGNRAEVRDMACVDDGDALINCFALLADWQAVEAWHGDRLVGRVTRPRGPGSPSS